MSGTETTIVVDGVLPNIAAIRPAGKLTAAVTWDTGQTSIVDLAPDVFTYKIYAPLRIDRSLFDTMRVVDDGNAIAWGDGAIDMPATAIERLAADVMTAGRLQAFMRGAGLTRDGLAAQLGVSRRLVGYWLEGQAIPRYIMLACQALAAEPGHRPTKSLNASP